MRRRRIWWWWWVSRQLWRQRRRWSRCPGPCLGGLVGLEVQEYCRGRGPAEQRRDDVEPVVAPFQDAEHVRAEGHRGVERAAGDSADGKGTSRDGKSDREPVERVALGRVVGGDVQHDVGHREREDELDQKDLPVAAERDPVSRSVQAPREQSGQDRRDELYGDVTDEIGGSRACREGARQCSPRGCIARPRRARWRTPTINTEPIASGSSAPAPVLGFVAVHTVNTRKNVPMNSTRSLRPGDALAAWGDRLLRLAGPPEVASAGRFDGIVAVIFAGIYVPSVQEHRSRPAATLEACDVCAIRRFDDGAEVTQALYLGARTPQSVCAWPDQRGRPGKQVGTAVR